MPSSNNKKKTSFGKTPAKLKKKKPSLADCVFDQPDSKTRYVQRAVLTHPESFEQVKDNTSARVFKGAARKVKELQICTTWEHNRDIKNKPKVQFILMSYDEMVSEPKKSYLSRYKREESQISFLVPTGFDPKAMGEVFEQIGKEMKTGCTSGRNWKVVQDIYEQHVRLFGTKKKFLKEVGLQKTNKQQSIIQSLDVATMKKHLEMNKSKKERTRKNDCTKHGN